MSRSNYIFGILKIELIRKVYECIKKMNGASDADILHYVNVKATGSNINNIDRFLDMLTTLYKDDKSGLWYVCPWKKREVYNGR